MKEVSRQGESRASWDGKDQERVWQQGQHIDKEVKEENEKIEETG